MQGEEGLQEGKPTIWMHGAKARSVSTVGESSIPPPQSQM